MFKTLFQMLSGKTAELEYVFRGLKEKGVSETDAFVLVNKNYPEYEIGIITRALSRVYN